MNTKSVSLLTLAVIVGCGLASMTPASHAQEGAKTVLRIGHVLPASHPVHPTLEYLAQRVSQLSAGTVKIQVVGDAKLGTEPELIEQTRRGTLDIVKTSAAALEEVVPEMAVFGMPFVFRDEKHYWNVLLGDIGKEILGSAETHGLHGLSYYDSGSRSFYTLGKPILRPADVRGMKLRVLPGKTSQQMVLTLGGTPTAIPYGDLHEALRKKEVDGAENNAPSLFTSRHYELARHYSLDEHTRVPDIVLISKKVWDRLDPQVRRWIDQAAAESVPYQRKLWRERTEEALKTMKGAGVTVHHVDREAFAAAMAPMYTSADGTRLGELARRIMVAE
ncbi:MAG TPA: TRAP transporter substrate-binding protein [Vicinamibacterales bacterium]|nr:TRAP transporter substrate-binding protein [Vicinamibacterales bacterium]